MCHVTHFSRVSAMSIRKTIGKGLFGRKENWECYSARVGDYRYIISEEKNYTEDKGWKIYKRDGGNAYVYALKKAKIGKWIKEGAAAHKLYDEISNEMAHSRHSKRNKYERIGYHEYAAKEGKDTKIYLFSLTKDDENPHKYNEEKTRLAIYYQEEYASGYFPTMRECLKYAEEKLSEEILSEEKNMGEYNEKRAVSTYNNIMYALGYEHKTIGEGWSEDTENWNLRDMLAEVDYVRSTFYESGHCNEDMRHGDEEERKEWRRCVSRLQRFIVNYEPYAEDMMCNDRHVSGKFDNYVDEPTNGRK